jgi:hypothetical protein
LDGGVVHKPSQHHKEREDHSSFFGESQPSSQRKRGAFPLSKR